MGNLQWLREFFAQEHWGEVVFEERTCVDFCIKRNRIMYNPLKIELIPPLAFKLWLLDEVHRNFGCLRRTTYERQP